MKPENELALIAGYYLSRFDKKGYELLGYKTFLEAVTDIGEKLGVKKNTVKNMRDEFDPYHQNTRVGWMRKLSPSRERILRSFQDTEDSTLIEIVKEILQNKDFKGSEEYKDIKVLFADQKKNLSSSGYIARGATGKAAEDFFQKNYQKLSPFVNGTLKDCRQMGGGYDFEITSNKETYFIEVKGLADREGSISITNKEWQMAQAHGNLYYFVVIKDVHQAPMMQLIRNPYSKLKPRKVIYPTIQISWNLPNGELTFD